MRQLLTLVSSVARCFQSGTDEMSHPVVVAAHREAEH
jgi:hypothetical protein